MRYRHVHQQFAGEINIGDVIEVFEPVPPAQPGRYTVTALVDHEQGMFKVENDEMFLTLQLLSHTPDHTPTTIH